MAGTQTNKGLCRAVMNPAPPQSRKILFALVPNFSMIAFATAVEPLRLANRILGRAAYQWLFISTDGEPVKASNGMAVQVDGALGDYRRGRLAFERSDLIVVCSGVKVEAFNSVEMNSWLRARSGQGIRIAGLCTGAWVLARAGLLEDRSCAIHWETLPAFAEAYPDVDVHADLFEIDDNIFTCAGGTASLDMMLHIIAEDFDDKTVDAVAAQCITDRVRGSHDRQRLPLRARIGIHNKKLIYLIELMEANIAEPLTLVELSRFAGLSRRHVERLFRQYLGRSPARYYLDLRLDRSRQLLMQSDMPIVDVAIACGFVSASHFSKCYRELYGRSPKADRLEATQAASEAG